MKKLWIAALSIWILIGGCNKEKTDAGNEVITLQVPKGFPYPDIPADNLPTKYRVELGKKLFFDPVLSRDSSIACGTCHLPEKYFADGLRLSNGIEGRAAKRNAPSLLNAAYLKAMFWDGGVPTLEQQVLAPIENHNEMDFNVNKVVQRLQANTDYPSLFNQAYNAEPSVYTLTRAIACYERTLFTGKSKYDEYQYYNDPTALNASEINGMNIFFGERGECFHCHNEYTFTDNTYKNNGLYLNYPDSGRAIITQNLSDIGKFKVPSLRNVAMTAPYMHDGSLATLEDVVEHYNSGGQPHPNKSSLLRPMNLTAEEKTDLVNFLKALTDL